jgi:subtilisin family serine protease
MNTINKFSISVYPLILIKGEPIVSRREMVLGFIQNNFPFLNAISLAHAKINDNVVEFQAATNEILKPIEDHSLYERREILQRYNKAIYEIEDYFKNYPDNNQNSIKEWKDILEDIFNPANNIIYANEKNIVLLWGLEFNNLDENFLPRNEVVFENINSIQDSTVDQKQIVDQVEDAETFEEKKDELNAEPINPQSINSIKPDKIIVRSNKKNSRSFISRLGAGFIDFFKRGWWFLLLLIFLLIWLNNQCLTCGNNSPSSSIEKGKAQTYLPPREGISIPIDSLDLGYGEDSVFLIANNRINVALKNKQEEFYAFINVLGGSFLNGSRNIIYYNEETARIQIEFDDSTNQNIKDEIRMAASNYDLLIWDESVFVGTFHRFNDPFLERAEISWYLDMIKMDKAWEISTGNKDVVVAVVDDGFDLTHNELRNTSVSQKYNVVEQQNQVYGNSLLNHGTHVSTTLLGVANNNTGLTGIAPNVTFMPVQIGSQSKAYFSNTDVIDGVLYALKNNASIINLSLGKQFSPQLENLTETQQKELINNFGKDEEMFWKELFSIAEKQNTTIVIAAGNSGILSGIDPMQRYENAIIVGAVDRDMKLASFSNYGAFNTICAPGVQIVSAVPGNSFAAMDGTSMAAPIVSGAIALYKSIYPNATNSEIKRKLKSSSQIGNVINVELLLK